MKAIRNVAIIAHVDHGKTTLVDALLRQSQTRFKAEVAESNLIMDSNELEKERGITIFSKNASVQWNDVTINIIDTPGHADFGGEVERVLTMADGCLLLVDAKEGPMPQTRFVLKRALDLNKRVVVVINKIDKPDARIDYVLEKTFELFVELGADEEAAFFPVVYASAKQGLAGSEPDLAAMTDIAPIFEAVMEYIPEPSGDAEKPLQFLVTSLRADSFRGRIGVGRIDNGRITSGQTVTRIDRSGKKSTAKITSLMAFNGLDVVDIQTAECGEIVAISGIGDVAIGETVADTENPVALPILEIEQPTLRMTFGVNTSPFAGKEGEYKTSRQIRARLMHELETDMALKVEDAPSGEWIVSGRGELHLSILIERMRREGYEFQVMRPQVITKEVDGKKQEPFERLFIDVPEEHMGVIMEKLGARGGQLLDMSNDEGQAHLEFLIATRSLFGFRNEFQTDTRGLGLMNTLFDSYRPDAVKERERSRGSLVSFEDGVTNLYGLTNAQDRGQLFIGPAVPVYRGQVVGENARQGDLRLNVCKEKHLTNMRSKGDGSAEHFNVPRVMDLEDSLEFIDDTELVEVTPKNVRIRKIKLSE